MQRHLPLLSHYLDLPNLTPFLLAKNLTTFDEERMLSEKWKEGHKQATVVELLALLQRKCPDWEDGLLEALRDSVTGQPSFHMGHAYILREIGKQNRGGDGRSIPANYAQQQHHSSCAYCIQLQEKINELNRIIMTLKQQNRSRDIRMELVQDGTVPIQNQKIGVGNETDLKPVSERMEQMLEPGTKAKGMLAYERREHSSDLVILRQTDPSLPEENVAETFSTMATRGVVENEAYVGDNSFGTETKNLAEIAEEVVKRAIQASTQKSLTASSVHVT